MVCPISTEKNGVGSLVGPSRVPHLAFPGGAEEPSLMSFVEYSNDATTVVNELVSRILFDLEAFRRR